MISWKEVAVVLLTNNRRKFVRWHTSCQRRGASIIPVIAFFAVAMAMIGVWVRSALTDQRVVQRWHEKTQTEWLAESGLRRAVARIKADKDYEGETWQLSAEQLGYQFGAEVEIKIEAIATSEQADEQQESQSLLKIVAVARYPSDGRKRMQATKSLFQFPAGGI